MHLPLAGIISGGITYLLRAGFTADDQSFTDAQVLDTPAEGVEIGQLTVTDLAAGTLDIASNELQGVGSGTFNETGFHSQAITRVSGVTLMIEKWNVDAYSGAASSFLFKIHSANQLAASAPFFIVSIKEDTTIDINDTGVSPQNVGVCAAATDYKFAIVVGGYDASGIPSQSDINGKMFFIKGGIYTNWTLLWKGLLGDESIMYFTFQPKSTDTHIVDDFKVVDDSQGLSTLHIPNNSNISVSTLDTFTHTADCFIEALITTLPSSGFLDIGFRIQDASNLWVVRFDASGALWLLEVVATVETTRIGPIGSALSNGETVKIVAEDEEISVYTADLARGTYSSAVNFKADTGGNIVFGSGAIAHLSDWVRTGYSDLDNF